VVVSETEEEVRYPTPFFSGSMEVNELSRPHTAAVALMSPVLGWMCQCVVLTIYEQNYCFKVLHSIPTLFSILEHEKQLSTRIYAFGTSIKCVSDWASRVAQWTKALQHTASCATWVQRTIGLASSGLGR
jgi:hypothetical protein